MVTSPRKDYDVQLVEAIDFVSRDSRRAGMRTSRWSTDLPLCAIWEQKGAMYADVDVEALAIANGEVPGPAHAEVATRAMTPTRIYQLLGY